MTKRGVHTTEFSPLPQSETRISLELVNRSNASIKKRSLILNGSSHAQARNIIKFSKNYNKTKSFLLPQINSDSVSSSHNSIFSKKAEKNFTETENNLKPVEIKHYHKSSIHSRNRASGLYSTTFIRKVNELDISRHK